MSQINVAAGILGFDHGAGNPGGGAGVVVSNGATLYLYNGQFGNFVNNLTLNGGAGVGGGGALQDNGGGNATETGTVMLNSGSSSISTAGGNLTLSGVVSGTGALTETGGNTLTLSNSTNSYNGGTTVSAGTLQIGDGTTNGSLGTGAVTNSSAMVFKSNAAGNTVGNAISGTGTLTQAAGVTNLTGADTYTGATAVNAGTLKVNGSLTSAVTVGGSGTTGTPTLGGGIGLAGSGVINANKVYTPSTTVGSIQGLVTISGPGTGAAGHLAPGNSVGTLSVNSLTLSSGSILDYEFNSSANDFTNVTTSGGLTLNGGGFNLYQEGTTSTFSTFGTYALLGYSGTLGGALSNLSVLNPVAGDKYTFTNTGSLIDLTIGANTTNAAYTLAAAPAAVNLHGGGTETITNTITNTGTGTADTLNYTNLTDTPAANISGAQGSGTLAQGAAGTGTQTFTAGTSSGTVTITPTANVTNATLGGSVAPTATTPASVHVYSGQETYTGPSGNYVNGSNAAVQTQWTGGGAPGIDAAFTGQDTATINGTGNGNVGQTVTLNGASPNLAAVTLGNGSTLAQGSGGTLTLDGTHASASGGTNGTATVTITGTGNTLSAPVTLATNTTANAAAGSALNLSGTLAGTGTLTVNGAGIVTLSATGNSYGNTVVGSGAANSGTLALTAAKADGGGSLTINTGGTVTLNTSNTAGGNFSALGGGGVILSGGTLANANLSAASGSNDATGETPQGNNYQSGGMLTLTSGTTSYLDFGLGNTGAVFNFSSLAIAGSAPGTLLDILNYKGNFTDGTNGGDGIDQLFIGGALPTGALGDIQFLNPSGYNGTVSAAQLMDGEISPAPEPGEWATLSMLGAGLGGLLLKARKRMSKNNAA